MANNVGNKKSNVLSQIAFMMGRQIKLLNVIIKIISTQRLLFV